MKIQVNLKDTTSYDVNIDEKCEFNFARKVAIISNETVAKLHLASLKEMFGLENCAEVIIKDGEKYKNLETLEQILNQLFEAKLDRASLIIAFGGGVVGDMSGFAAAIYQRGIDFIQVPTTLLACVDSSVGGKTGVNNKFGKNLIGSFYQPKAVFIYTNFLKTLPKREFKAGVCEALKMAITFDKEFFKFFEEADFNESFNKEILEKLIQKSVQTKANVVSLDEKEKGLRAALNYGHTFAHVIENETNYETYLHGEAVSMGIIMANRLSVKLGILSKAEESRIENLLKKLNLPISYKVKSATKFYEAFFLDKKSKHSKITFVLSCGIGEFKFYDNIDKNLVLEVLEEFK